ncbi:conserved hypothetical protein [Paraburkholderia piptadeniae]|uniref:Uncharacterized protein n=1 Tax=Paraburkholderia piptadeniae TaxID=1701573 RepID=A0A1N7SNC7_9BURK|nr:hypothetical protein [Paraburkholderia piptadeniae]SIT48936.1 conserved hypothetical protein [Paraburkholderia piptadeniae]
MQTEDVTEYRGCMIRPIVTAAEGGRYTAAAIVMDREGETRTLGVEGDFAEYQEARDQAMELAIAWIHRRNIVSDHYVKRG